MAKLTREEKTVVRAYLKMAYVKGWYKPSEYEMSKMIDNMYTDCRSEMEEFIDKEWNKLLDKEFIK